ncbi:MAG: tRNA (adenosine(37)-N6)-threonylcarbamoyltransferase complex dimerization subunit type 1 TsaB [Magnetococcales bacterium]|nr:tRNA (adenosine(37)-N6)-threonylcarbamoyltransferase complex dimerization subunit type 1 TsaB [Magnetococcales bacterium]NGZ06231.1 tRNA (adenosine(37)-N6)-threonylcarbamoyltransferase complex dimerization subunit type 1 TsaB [Magnetococcales bacterium]
MKILAMDTSGAHGAVALLEGERVVMASGFTGQAGHVVGLPLTLERLLKEVGWRTGDLNRLAVTLGPGSFSGVRMALGVAKGLAVVHGMPVVGFSTLEVVAAGAGVEGDVAAVLDARRGEVYAAVYTLATGHPPGVQMVPGVWDPGRLAAALQAWKARSGVSLTLVGDGLSVYPELLQRLVDRQCQAADPAAWPLDVRLLGRMAARWGHDREPCATLLEPLYVRHADAKEPGGVVVGGA